MAFHRSNGLAALDCNRKPTTRPQRLHSYDLALSHETNRTVRPWALHVHGQTHGSTRRHLIAGLQEQASDAYVLADGFEFADYPARWKTQADWKLKVEPPVPSLFVMGSWLEGCGGTSGLLHILRS